MILLLSYSLFLLKGEWMKKDRFHLYHIDMKYIRDLAKADDNVMSISPQIGKNTRPFVGGSALLRAFDFSQSKTF